MSEVMITVVGNVATEPRMDETKKGERFASFRLACNSQRYDSRTRTWVDDDASYYTVYCWRAPLADNIKTSLHKGDPVLVYGRLKNREWRDDNNAMRVSPEITARSLGHDLYRGISLFTKVSRQPILPEDDDAVDTVRAAYLAHEQGVDRRTGEILTGPQRAAIQPAPGWPPDGARPMDAGRSQAGARQPASVPSMNVTTPERGARPTGVMVVDATRPMAGAPPTIEGRPVVNLPPIDGVSNGHRPANTAPAPVGDRLTAGDYLTAGDRMMGADRSAGRDPAMGGDRVAGGADRSAGRDPAMGGDRAAGGEDRSAGQDPATASDASAKAVGAGAPATGTEMPTAGAEASTRPAPSPRTKSVQPRSEGTGSRPEATSPSRSTSRARREKAGVGG